MRRIESATLTIWPDEKAMALVEVNLMAPDGKGRHRYQIIYVARGERLAEYRVDLGPSRNFVGAEFRLVGGVHHADGRVELIETVGNLQDWADDFRARPPFIPDPLALRAQLERAVYNRNKERRNA